MPQEEGALPFLQTRLGFSPDMRSSSYLRLPVAALLLALPTVVLAQADPQTASLARTLKQGVAPAHRVQAARVLGDSEDPQAVEPLCGALTDESAEVRTAAAGALRTLGEPAALACLKARKEEEPAAEAARSQAVTALEELQARPPRVYVMLGEVKDTTGGLSPELMKLTEARLRRKLFQVGALLAPAGESEAAAKAVLARHKLPGYRLLTEVRPGPAGGLKVSVMCLRYPGKQLLGNVEVQAADAEPGDLLAALIPRAIDETVASYKWK
jgi:hypothetical protein